MSITGKEGKATRQIPFRTVVQKVDPDFDRARRNEPEYQFSRGRVFTADPSRRGAYDGTVPDPDPKLPQDA